MRFLITGAAGFPSRSLANRLVREGRSVRGLDDLSAGDQADGDFGLAMVVFEIMIFRLRDVPGIRNFEQRIESINIFLLISSGSRSIFRIFPWLFAIFLK